MGDVFFPIDDDGVAGVSATAPARHDLGVFGEQVNDLTLAFIAPLSANDYYYWHLVLRPRRRAEKEAARAGMCFLVHVIMESKRNGTNRCASLVNTSGVGVPVTVPTQIQLGQPEHNLIAIGALGERAVDFVEDFAACVARME